MKFSQIANTVNEKIGFGNAFAAVMLAVYAALALLEPAVSSKSSSFLVSLLEKILPVFVVVFALIFVSNYFLNVDRVKKYLGKTSGAKGWAAAVIGGLLSTGPIYLWYPLLADLKEKGMKNSLIAVFLYNRAVKLPLLPLMVHYFGLAFTVVLTFYTILFSIANGLIVARLVGEQK